MAEAKKPKKRRKPKAARKEGSIRIRVNESQKETLSKAAERAGIGLSSWMLVVCLKEAGVGSGEK